MVHVKQDMHGSWGCVLVLKGNTVWKKSLWLDSNPSLRLYQSNFLKSLPVSHLSLECWTTKMQRGVIGLCQLTAIMLWSAKCCIAASKDMGSTLPWCCMCCSLVPCLESLIVAADQGPCSGTVLGYDRTTTTLLPSRAVLSSTAAWDPAEGLSKLRHWGSPEAAILCFLCCGCCIHLLPKWFPKSTKHPQGAQQFFRTILLWKTKAGRVSILLSQEFFAVPQRWQKSVECLAIPMQMESVNKCPQGLFWD